MRLVDFAHPHDQQISVNPEKVAYVEAAQDDHTRIYFEASNGAGMLVSVVVKGDIEAVKQRLEG